MSGRRPVRRTRASTFHRPKTRKNRAKSRQLTFVGAAKNATMSRDSPRSGEAMNVAERIAGWKKIAVSTLRDKGLHKEAKELNSQVWKTEDNLFGLFSLFRPTGEGVEGIFQGIEHGDQIVERLRRVYDLTNE